MLSKIREVKIAILPDAMQRFDTNGDWFFTDHNGVYDVNGHTLNIVVSQMNDPRHSTLVLVHQLMEALFCTHNGVSAIDMDKFRLSLTGSNYDDPDNHPAAPHYKEHKIAAAFEQITAQCLMVDWKDYQDVTANSG